MPAVFKKIKVKAKTGRGEGTDGMLEEFLAIYPDAKATFDGAEKADQDAIVDGLNSFKDGIGTSFATDFETFEMDALDILDHAGFFAKLKELGFEIEGL